MARIVRAIWSPADPQFGSYGVLGAPHPEFAGYRWVEWIDEGGSQARWSNGEPAEGFYNERDLKMVGTALIA